ncbi:MAG TPA: ABC transporter ATP-binding protein, partial [Ktedonobacterales bacterium]
RSISFARINSLVWPTMTFVSGLAIAILLWRGGSEVIDGSLRLGQLVQFNTYLTALAFPMIGLGWSINLFQQGSASSARIQEVLTTAPTIADGALTREGFTPTHGEVEFRDVTLRYGDGPEVLREVSFTVPAGGWLAIVGATGSGKTTIVNLIPRLFDVTGGQVLVDGVDVREIPLDALRRSVGYVPQETFLFSLSLEENVAFGMATPARDRVDTAARVSQLAKDLEDFPQGIETVIGERGVTLSGGQKQRASIARAVARDPLILILDDALSSVDTNTEAAILRGLHDVMRGRTAITIAHRVSTIRDADEILVLDAGRIAERGTHASLLAEGGLYAAMYRRQLLTEELSDDDGPDPGAPDPAEAPDGLVD